MAIKSKELEALESLVNELDLQKDKLPKDNDRLWDRIYNAKNVIKETNKTIDLLNSGV